MTRFGYELVAALLVGDVVFLFWLSCPRSSRRNKGR
jgi:hypothetical protein